MVRTTDQIIHNLIALPGTKIEDIREVYSHPRSPVRDYLNSTSHAQALPFRYRRCRFKERGT